MVISVWRVRQLEALAKGEAVAVAEAEVEAEALALALGVAVLAGTAGEVAVLLLAF
jgi:UTP-glucose-1-phosphate uridylyltransferase